MNDQEMVGRSSRHDDQSDVEPALHRFRRLLLSHNSFHRKTGAAPLRAFGKMIGYPGSAPLTVVSDIENNNLARSGWPTRAPLLSADVLGAPTEAFSMAIRREVRK